MGRKSTSKFKDSYEFVRQGNQALPRTRKWAPKVKTGCLTCRLRHVKCDEHKPSCHRCLSARRTCVGNENDLDEERRAQGDWILVTKPEPPAYPKHVTESCGEEEQRMFDLFQTQTVHQLAGYFDQDFWTKDLIDAAEKYPCIWHACIALAATYKSLLGLDSQAALDSSLNTFALKQYTLAIRQLYRAAKNKCLSTADKAAFLMANVLITIVSSLRGDLMERNTHIMNGLQLFYDWRIWEQGHPVQRSDEPVPLPIDSLIAIILRIDTQTMQFRNSWSFENWLHVLYSLPDRPFDSPTRAYLDLEVLANGATGLTLLDRLSMASACTRVSADQEWAMYDKAYSVWKTKFAALVESHVDAFVFDYDQMAMEILHTRRVMNESIVAMARAEQHSFSKATLEARCEEIVSRSENILAGPKLTSFIPSTTTIPRSYSPLPSLSSSHSMSASSAASTPDAETSSACSVSNICYYTVTPYVGDALCWVTTFCPCPTTMGRAIDLLKQNPGIDGLCDMRDVTRLTEGVEIE